MPRGRRSGTAGTGDAATGTVLDDRQLFEAQKRATTLEEREAIGEIRLEFALGRLQQAAATFTEGSAAFLDLIGRLEAGIRRIGHAPELEKLLETARETQIDLHRKETGPAPLEGDPVRPDEADAPLAFDAVGPAERPDVPAIHKPPKTIDAAAFTGALADEYERFFHGGRIREERLHLVGRLARAALANQSRYETVGGRLAIPWWFIAAVHMMESTFNFGAHFHNGDPLKRRTRRVPSGRPQAGEPPFTWEESALDALVLQKLDNLKDWSLARVLHRLERYNGFGYRKRRLPSPYLWSFSTLYEKGKFVRDGKFSPSAVSQQCGAAVLLRYLSERGDIRLDGEQEETGGFDPAEDVASAATDPTIEHDDSPFAVFWRERLPEIMHFKPREFLFKGASHVRNGLNTDPPKELWANVVPLVKVLDRVRADIGKPVKLISVYRSPAYNRAVGGAANSCHMRFIAADFTVVGDGDVRGWARAVHRLRDRNLFTGGIGVYPGRKFVHVDVRGHNVNWTG